MPLGGVGNDRWLVRHGNWMLDAGRWNKRWMLEPMLTPETRDEMAAGSMLDAEC